MNNEYLSESQGVDTTLCLDLLRNWAGHAERYWYPMPDDERLGCYGTGYDNWGVQTNQKYLGAMAVLGVLGEREGMIPAHVCQQARARALTALRYSLRSHVSGDYRCTDGTQWGHTWISALGIERMMHGVYLLEPHFTDQDHAALRRVLTSEADWLLDSYYRGAHKGVAAGVWNHSGVNAPESNVWNGALLWRTAVTYPDHPHASRWREQAHRFLINAVSVSTDAQDERIVAGKPVSEWHVGANFFPNYALDHHGYLNVGYMVVCLSNAAMLHFDLKAVGLPAPESLHHHQADLWQVVRKLVFADGRLARIGGDSRLRYTYCQEYLLPSLVYAADRFGEPHAATLIQAQLELIQQEATYSQGGAALHHGSFYGRRLAPLIESSPYYYTRLESDRACVLGMLVAYWRQFQGEEAASPLGSSAPVSVARTAFERSVAGPWCDADHGAVLHRAPSRLASFAWRAHGLAQGMCQPPDDGHLAEWAQNLGGLVRFLGDDGLIQGGQTQRRRLLDYHIDPFDGGFVTCGAVMEGVGLTLAEGWRREGGAAVHQIAFVALPDGHTVVGLQHCRTAGYRAYVAEVKGLHLNVPNDLYNRYLRRLAIERGEALLQSPPERDAVIELDSVWTHVDGRLGVVGLYGAEQLVVHRSAQRRGGKYHSLYVDEICFGYALGTRSVDPGSVLLDVGWAVLSDVDGERTRRFGTLLVVDDHPHIRAIRLRGLDGREYVVLANFGAESASPPTELFSGVGSAVDLVTGEDVMKGRTPVRTIQPCRAHLFVLGA